MDGSVASELLFPRAIRRIGGGVLCQADLRAVQRHLKGLQDVRNNDSDAANVVYEALDQVAQCFNQFMQKSVVLLLSPTLQRRINTILRKMTLLLKRYRGCGLEDRVLKGDKVGLCHLGMVDPRNCRAEQLSVLKRLISDINFAFSPRFTSMIAPLLDSISAEEFEAQLFPDALRLLKRGQKDIIFKIFVLFKYMKINSVLSSAIEIIDNLKVFLPQQDEEIPVFGGEKLPIDALKIKGIFSHIVSDLIHRFSMLALRSPNCRLASYMQELIGSFSSATGGNVSTQETNSWLLLLLLPDQIDNSIDVEAISKFVCTSSVILKKIAKSHPHESVQVLFIQIIGRILSLIHDSDLEVVLIDMLVDMVKPLDKVTAKSKDIKLNERVLYSVLYSLRCSVSSYVASGRPYDLKNRDRLSCTTRTIIQFFHDKPVYRNCLFEAVYIMSHLEFAAVRNGSTLCNSDNLSKDQLKLQDVFGSMLPHLHDPLSHLNLCTTALRNADFTPKDSEVTTLMNQESISGIVDVALSAEGGQSYATMVQLYEHITANKDHLKHPVMKSFHTRRDIDMVLKAFVGSLQEHHAYRMLLTMLVSPPNGNRMTVLKMLRDVWLSLNVKSDVFTVLLHCILFRRPLDGFEKTVQLAKIINGRVCKVIRFLRPIPLEGNVVAGIVHHSVAEGCIPSILEHHLAAHSPDISATLATLLVSLKSLVTTLKSFDREDCEIYFAPAEKLYMDSRPYQPNLHQSDKKKSCNLTKQQLDDMRYKDQCVTRAEIALIVRKVNAIVYVLSRAFVHNRDYLPLFLRDVLGICKEALAHNVLHSSFYLLLEVLCPLCLTGGLSGTATNVLKILDTIYSKPSDHLTDEPLGQTLDEVRSSGVVTFESSLLIIEIVTHVLQDPIASTSLKESSLMLMLIFLESRIVIPQEMILAVVSENMRNESLHHAITMILNEAVKYIVDQHGITEICKIGLLSKVGLVKEAVRSHVYHHTEALCDIPEYLKLLGIGVGDARCKVKEVIDLVPKYIQDNADLLHLAPGVFAQYPPDDVISSFAQSFGESNDDGRKSLLKALKCYFDILDGDICHSVIFDVFFSITGDSSNLHDILACCRALSNTVPESTVLSLIEHVKSSIEDTILKSFDGTMELGSLESERAVMLGVGLTFMGYLQDNSKTYVHVKWSLELLLSLLASESEFSKVEAGSHTAAIIASHARKCALEGEDDFINDNIKKLFAASFNDDYAIVPCISLLKGGGLSYLKKHEVIAKLKDSFSAKGNQRRLTFVKELANQFGRLFEPYIKDILPNLLSCFPDAFDPCLETCLAVVGVLTPVGFKSALPVITESIGGYVCGVKLGCLLILNHVINDVKLRDVVIKNICGIVKAVSPCTTDTQKAVKDASDKVLDSIVYLAGEGSILYPTMNSILKVLSHPSDVNIASTMQVLSEYSIEHPNGDGCSTNPVGLVELGLMEPILSRALRSRNGTCRESAIAFSSWLVYRCRTYREVELFFTTLLPNLTDLLKDTLPDVRREAARAIGSCAHSFRKFNCDTSKALIVDLINRLMKCLMESVTSLERCSAASGLAEALWAVDDEFVHGLTTKLLTMLESSESTPQVREGCLALFNNLPSTCYQYMLDHLNEVLCRVMAILCDPDERVRDMSCQVLNTVIEKYHSSATDVLMIHLKMASQSDEWQRRNLVLPLLHKMNTFQEDKRVSTELYIARYDRNATVKNTAMSFWKGVNVTRCLRQIFPLVLERVIEMLEKDDDEDLRAQAGDCISDAIVRLGSDAINDFIEALLSGDGAFKGRCMGIASLASNGKAGLEKHLSTILEFLKHCLCKPVSCHEASMALAALATYFPTVVSDVLPSLVQDLFISEEKEAYLVGITLLMDSHSECFDIVVKEVLKPDLDVTRLALLERVLCTRKTKVVFSQQNVLVKCISQLLLYHREYPMDVMSSFSNFVCLVKPEVVLRLIQVVIEMLNDMTAGPNNDCDKSALLIFVSRVIELRESDIDGHYGTIADALARYIFTDVGTMEANLTAFDQIIRSAERRTELDNLICAILRYFSSLQVSEGHVPQTTLSQTLPLIMGLIQKCLVKSNAKVEAAKCVAVVHKLAGRDKMGPFTLKTIGAIIRSLNDKCPSLLKIALLEAIYALLHCEIVHVRVIMFQLQSVLFKCLTDVNSDINLLIPQNLRLYVQLAPTKADSVLADLFQLAMDKVGKPTVKTAAIHTVNEVLKVCKTLSTSPFERLMHMLQESSGTDKQLVCKAIGLATQLDSEFDPEWLQTLFLIIHEDQSTLMALTSLVSSDRGFTLLYKNKPKEFVDVLKHSLRSDIPSVNQCGLAIFCRISKRTRYLQAARDFVKSHINILPSGSKLPPNGQSQVLQIYKRFLRFEQKIPNFGSQLLYLSEAIYDIPLIKLEAEKVLLVLLGPSRDLSNLKTFVKQYSTSEKVEKLLTEYAIRVLLKSNKVDQLSDEDC